MTSADCGGLRATIGAAKGIAHANVPDKRAETRKHFINWPAIVQQRDWIEINPKPRTARGGQGALE